jgi:DNA-binding PadR family transcriptional regulator
VGVKIREQVIRHLATIQEDYPLHIANTLGRRTGPIYVVLAQLESRGLVESRRDATTPSRQYYRLSEAGHIYHSRLSPQVRTRAIAQHYRILPESP